MYKYNIAYITNNIAPFRIDLLDELATNSSNVDLYYFQEIDKGVNPEYVKRRPQKAHSTNLVHYNIIKRILKVYNHDIVIFDGYSGINKILLMMAMIMIKKEYYISIDGIILKEKKDSFIKLYIKKFLFAHSKGIFSTNKSTDDIICSITKNVPVYRHIFTTLYREDINYINKIDKELVKKKYEISNNRKTILFVGKFLATKGIRELLNSIEEKYNYIFVGGTYEELRKYSQKIPSNVSCIKFLEKREILELMSIVDVFVLPTYTDVWGLVIIEALSCGVPIVTTNKCNAGIEFVKDGINGFIVSIQNWKEIKKAITKTLELDKEDVKRYDNNLIADYTIENAAKNMLKKFNIGGKNES